MPTIASSATSVLIAHVTALTRTIRLGAGGIMLPNHASSLLGPFIWGGFNPRERASAMPTRWARASQGRGRSGR
jgi:hypothetical protein